NISLYIRLLTIKYRFLILFIITDFTTKSDEEPIISAMKAAGVNRYITWATPSIRSDEDRRSVITVVPGIMASIFLPKAKKCIRQIISDVVDSGLQWTVVRFMAPKDTAPSGKVKVSFGQRKIRFNISRADIASFMVSQVGSKEYIGRMPIIGY
ncbi:NAD(P)H-binding protein, partial [Bacteroides sp.]|uniref:NAD(P)H-binding protein n=1 Tax=Bacteroides sp. TaxID=29523 RepID=UPI003A8CA65E